MPSPSVPALETSPTKGATNFAHGRKDPAMMRHAEIPSPHVGMRYVVDASGGPGSSRFPDDTLFRRAERR